MNNNTRGFVALLFLDVLVPMTAPPTINHQPGYCFERRSSGGTESRSRAAGGAMERGSERSDGEGERVSNLILRCMFLEQAPVCCNSF